ncbi:MAG: hypothetical protein ACRED0_02700 [Gammaproteobacteria bacterium]
MVEPRRGIWWFVFVMLPAYPALVLTAEWYVDPSVSARYEFDDNRFLRDDSQSASTWKFSPFLVFGRRTPNTELTGTARVEVNESNREELDTTNAFFALLPVYRTERSVWRLNASYRRDTTLRTSILEPAFDPLVLTGEVVPVEGEAPVGEPLPVPEVPISDDIGLRREEIERNVVRIAPEWRRELFPRLDLGLRYSYTDTFYSDAEQSNVVDSQRHLGTADLSYRLSEVDDLGVVTSFQNFQNDQDSDFDAYGLQLGLQHRFSETLRGIVTAGPEYTDRSSGDSDLSFAFGFGVDKRFEESNLGVFFRRGVAPSEAGNALQTNELNIRWFGDISPRLSFSFLARAFRNEGAGDSQVGADERYYAQVEPTLSYELTENIFVDLGYRFRWQDSDDVNATGNAAQLAVGYRLDRFSLSR